MTENWIILGATSSMARAFARAVSERGDSIFLAGRDMEDIRRTAIDCTQRGARMAEAVAFDARKPDGFAAIIARLERQEGQINAAVFVGSMPGVVIN